MRFLVTDLSFSVSRGLRWFALATSLACAANAQQQPDPIDRTAAIDQYCVVCHNERTNTAELPLDVINEQEISKNPAAWERVVRQLRVRYMPPPGLPRPSEEAYDALVASLSGDLERIAAAKPDPGRTDTFRRLNRTEYRNAIRDLLAVDVDVSSLLPSDETSHGFDNIIVGELSPTLLERYLAAAANISRLSVGGDTGSPTGEVFMQTPDLTQESRLETLPFGTRGGMAVKYNFPLDGEYEIQVRLARDRDSHIEGLNDEHKLDVTIDGKSIQTFTLQAIPSDVTDHYAIDKDLRVRVPVKAGPHVVSATFFEKTSALLETERQPYHVHFNMDRHPRIQPAVYTITVLGPYQVQGPGDTPSRDRLFVCRPEQAAEEEACAKRILSTVMRRAYRRPVNEADLATIMPSYTAARAEAGFERGIEMALRAVLVNPNFLFRVEREPENIGPRTAYPVSDFELASRLSFFLWSSIPDDELLDVAAQEKLRDPAVLERQVRRMLADARSEALVTSFASQWLFVRNLAFTVPDPREFPDFDDNLRQSFRRETELFFESIVKEDRSLPEMLTANYTFLNERLAKHYGIDGVYGSRFRRVALDGNNMRGGLLSQGSILTVTSYATRTSPVIRGKWILSNIFGVPPPPPPPVVPELKVEKVEGKPLTMRDRLAEHRANPACVNCHRLMDPLGFALENYDAVGRWRDSDEGAPIDAAGNLPDGSSFDGIAGLREVLAERPELFVTATTEKLLTYALGRGLEYYDYPAVRRIVSEASQDDYRFSSLVLGIVESTPFQMRRSQ
jgi:hypothetical protein